jgi:hypothetical protein
MTSVLDHHIPALDEFAAASLAELAGEAALMTRTDRKYVVPTHSLPSLVAALGRLDPDLKVLDIDGRRRHRYDSTYLDTPELEAYWRAARRRRRRFKIRTRHYVDTGKSFTEVKTRGPRGSTVKARVPRESGEPGTAAHLLSDEDRFVDAELDSAGLGHVDVAGLVPTLRTGYLRSTLWLPGCHARVTFDVDLAWSLPWGDTIGRLPVLAIVETKAAGARTGVDRTLWTQGHRPVGISKYGTGMALMLPDLPAHRWHRVLTRHLQPHVRHSQIQETP